MAPKFPKVPFRQPSGGLHGGSRDSLRNSEHGCPSQPQEKWPQMQSHLGQSTKGLWIHAQKPGRYTTSAVRQRASSESRAYKGMSQLKPNARGSSATPLGTSTHQGPSGWMWRAHCFSKLLFRLKLSVRLESSPCTHRIRSSCEHRKKNFNLYPEALGAP